MELPYEIKDDTLIIDAKGKIGIFWIEESKDMMEFVNSVLTKYPFISRIVVKESREIEYLPEQVQKLKEIADIYKVFVEEKGVLRLDFFPNLNNFTKEILSLLLGDPIFCYFRIIFYLSKINNEPYKREFLLPLKEMLEKTKLFKEVREIIGRYPPGSRDIYRFLFSPITKPYWFLSRIILNPSKNYVLIDKYFLKDGSEVNIFKVPGKVKLLYNLIPKEFTLTDERVRVIEEAKNRIGELNLEELKSFENARRIIFEKSEAIIKEICLNSKIYLLPVEIKALAEITTRNTVGFGVLEILAQDEKIQDIYINAPIGSSPIFLNHSDFEECETNIYPSFEEAESWATKLRLYSGRPLDEANPVLDAELTFPYGRLRVAAITRSLSQAGLAFAFRRHREAPWTFPLFMRVKYFNPLFAGLMSFIIDGGRSVLVAGGRGSGKTSLLSSMILELMRRYRIVILEDTPELPISIYMNLGYNVQHLKSRSVITHVETELAPEEALRTALRLGDSALIVGEVRSKESTVLFEAMRIGALANLVAGTIHGESAYGVYDRVVHDLGLVPTSFKALDIIVIANLLKSPDGLHRFRRVVEVVEVRKNWKEDPMKEGAFVPLMTYSAKEDTLKPTDVLLNGESEVLNEISKRVREWHGAWDKVWENILLRGKIKQTMVEYAEKLNRQEILEASYVVEANEAFHSISEEVLSETGSLDSNLIYEKWFNWFKQRLKE